MLTRSFIFVCLFFFSNACFKDPPSKPVTTEPVEITTKILTQNLSFPWEILWGPDNFIWMTQRPGILSRVDPSNGTVTPVYTFPDIVSNGEGGLLGMALHPQFDSNPYVFVAYEYDKAGTYTEKIVRYTYSAGTLKDPLILLDGILGAVIHNGCRLRISADNKLFISTGDAGNPTHAQDITSLNGKILRVNLDGTIPSDNPDPSSPVWSYGHRNPQGLIFVKDSLYESEHGPDTDDEINIIHKGANYGWPDVRGFCDQADEKTFCDAHNITEPLKNWTPTIAVSGIDYYDNDLIPQWKNSLLACTLKGTRLVQLELSTGVPSIKESHEFFNGAFGRLRDACVSPTGKVYLCTSNGDNDKIIELSRK